MHFACDGHNTFKLIKIQDGVIKIQAGEHLLFRWRRDIRRSAKTFVICTAWLNLLFTMAAAKRNLGSCVWFTIDIKSLNKGMTSYCGIMMASRFEYTTLEASSKGSLSLC